MAQQSTSRPRIIVSWAEEDALTRWRKLICACARPGYNKWVKNQAIRRERRNIKAEIVAELDDYYRPDPGG